MTKVTNDPKGVLLELQTIQKEVIALTDKSKGIVEKEKSELAKIDSKNKDKTQIEKEWKQRNK